MSVIKSVKMRFQPSPAGIASLKRRPQTTDAMESIAGKIARRAERNGSRFTKGYESKSLGVGKARAGTDHPFAHWDEWGTLRRAPRAPLRRAISQLGLGRHLKES